MKDATKDVVMKNVPRDLWRQFKAEADLEGKTIPQMFTKVFKEFLKRKKK